MTARLTNSIALRLGMNHAWKTKLFPQNKKGLKRTFLYEQQLRVVLRSFFRTRLFKKQSILFGQNLIYPISQEQANFDVFFYDLGYSKILREVKGLRPYRFFSNTKIRSRSFSKRKKILSKKKEKIYKHLAFVLSRQKKQKKFDKHIKTIFFKLIRYYYLGTHKQRLIAFLSKLLRRDISKLKVRMFSLDKNNFPLKLLMAFIIKKLFLRFTIFEAIRPFRLFLSSRTFGFVLRTCGKLSKKQRAWYIKRQLGSVSNNEFSQRISYMYKDVTLKYGNAGVKLWISL